MLEEIVKLRDKYKSWLESKCYDCSEEATRWYIKIEAFDEVLKTYHPDINLVKKP